MSPEKPGEDRSLYKSAEASSSPEKQVEVTPKNELKIGDKVKWQLDGILMWNRKKVISEIRLDEKTNKMCGYFEGDERGYPIEDLTRR